MNSEMLTNTRTCTRLPVPSVNVPEGISTPPVNVDASPFCTSVAVLPCIQRVPLPLKGPVTVKVLARA